MKTRKHWSAPATGNGHCALGVTALGADNQLLKRAKLGLCKYPKKIMAQHVGVYYPAVPLGVREGSPCVKINGAWIPTTWGRVDRALQSNELVVV